MTFPSSLTGRFEPLELLGKGGMGIVHRARIKATGEVVALKLLEPSLSSDAEMRVRFKAEVRLASRVKHPNVVGVIDSGETPDGQLFMATELVEGRSLRRILEAEGTLPPVKVVGIARALLAGLAAVHRQGIIHRDIKPTNILIDRLGTLKIIDFGIAKDVAEQIQRTRSGELLGTPWYLTPEQIRGDRLSPATDVYSAGVIFYEALAGRPPFTGQSLYEIIGAHLNSPLEPLLGLAPQCPPELAQIVEKMLAREPQDRYPDAHQAHKAVRAYARESTVGPISTKGSGLYKRDRDGRPATTETDAAPETAAGPDGRRRPGRATRLSPSAPRASRKRTALVILMVTLTAAVATALLVHRGDLFPPTPTEQPVSPSPTLAGAEKVLDLGLVPLSQPDEPYPGARHDLAQLERSSLRQPGPFQSHDATEALARGVCAVIDRTSQDKASALWWQKTGSRWFHVLVVDTLAMLIGDAMVSRSLTDSPPRAEDMERMERTSPSYAGLRTRILRDEVLLSRHPAYWLTRSKLGIREGRSSDAVESALTAVYTSRNVGLPLAPWSIRKEALEEVADLQWAKARDDSRRTGRRQGALVPGLRAIVALRQLADEASLQPLETGAGDPRARAQISRRLAEVLRLLRDLPEAREHLTRARDFLERTPQYAQDRQEVEATFKVLDKEIEAGKKTPSAPLVQGAVADQILSVRRARGGAVEREALAALEAIGRAQDRSGASTYRVEQIDVLGQLATYYLSWAQHPTTLDGPGSSPASGFREAARFADWALAIVARPDGAAARPTDTVVRLLVTRAVASRSLSDEAAFNHFAGAADRYVALLRGRLADPAAMAALIAEVAVLKTTQAPPSASSRR